jgi:hypothetical protein
VSRCSVAVTAVVGASLSLVASGCTGGGGAPTVGWTAARQLPIREVVAGTSLPQVTSLWCGLPGTCILVGSRYKFRAPEGASDQDFAVSQAEGAWRPPQVLAGPGAAEVHLSCSAPGSCVAAETAVTVNSSQVFVAAEEHGSWSRMRPAPGLTALAGAGGGSAIDALACSATGNCVVVGNFWPAGVYAWRARFRPFLVTERDGTWSHAQSFPWLAALGAQGISDISCDPAGTCTVAGYFPTQSGNDQPFAVSGHDRTWGHPRPLTASPRVQHAGNSVDRISCASPGNCSAAGTVGQASGGSAPLPSVVTETAGTWGRAVLLPGAPVVHVQPGGDFASTVIAGLSCSAPGQCGLAGYSASISSGEHANVDVSAVFVASQVHGTWAAAQPIPGLTALSRGAPAVVTAMSCAAPGDCAAGGYYAKPDGNEHAWLATETQGTWGQAMAVPGLTALGSVESEVTFIACKPGANPASATRSECTAIGDYHTRSPGSPEYFFGTATA